MQRSNLQNKRQGFTLIELMVATGIMALLVLMVMSMTSNVLDVWTNASGRLNANAQAREALKYLGDDLEAMVTRPKKQAWLEVSYENNIGPLSENAPNISIITATEHRERENSGGGTIEGSVSVVNYRLAYQNPLEPGSNAANRPKLFALYRMTANPLEVFQSTILTTTYVEGDITTGLKSQIEANFGGRIDPRFATLLSPNIVRLRVVFYARFGDDNVIRPLVDSDGRPYPFIYADRIYFTGTAPADADEWRELEYAEIQLTALSDRGSKLMHGMSDASAGDLRDLVAEEGEVYSRRVLFFGR